ncbi:hypothetical protein PHYPSEUDO_005951 [Phytophthora pseudosyringae]|uniref:Uncharacterized protein n=1 Tax=Phytophthora pseudosyringae TaxID=221518 RepID=A0A8T1VN97_9STRA|nr:hypothetical protein PHYPSEUDO_005951 [Phytophthora pseudosyringae]
MVAATWGMASDELESIEPERGAMAPPESPVGPESDAEPELLCAVAAFSDEPETDAELAALAELDAADFEEDDDVVAFDEPEAESATAALALLALAEATEDEAADVAALALDDATADDVEAVEAVEAAEAGAEVVVVVVVAPETLEMASAARSRTWSSFMAGAGVRRDTERFRD